MMSLRLSVLSVRRSTYSFNSFAHRQLRGREPANCPLRFALSRHLVGVCQTAVLREPSRSSGHEFVQRCVLLTFSCCQSQSMFVTSRQPQSMFVTIDAGPLTQVSQAMSNASFGRPPTMRHPALLIHSCISF